MKTLEVFKLDSEATLPKRNSPTDGGLDLYALEDVYIPLGQSKLVKTGIAIRVPEGQVGRISGRSSMNKRGIITAHGVIDTGYSGDVSVVLHNFSCTEHMASTYSEGYIVKKGDRIAQFVIYDVHTPVPVEVEELWTSERGQNGFGSSGR